MDFTSATAAGFVGTGDSYEGVLSYDLKAVKYEHLLQVHIN